MGFIVADEDGRYIDGLKPSDVQVFEDGIRQKLYIFAEGGKPPLLLNADGTTPLLDPRSVEEARKLGPQPRENSYIITYYPDPSNHNQGYRIIKLEIVTDAGRRWRVKARPGYRPGYPPPRG